MRHWLRRFRTTDGASALPLALVSAVVAPRHEPAPARVPPAPGAKDTEETTEFFVPPEAANYADYVGTDDIAALHHLARYKWATRVLADRTSARRIIDIACGAGYGSAAMARTCPDASVLGCDYDVRAVELAASRHAAPNLRYAQADMVRWSAGGADLGMFDVIASIDMVEHISHRDIALLNLCRHPTDDRVLLLSTPCSHEATLLNAEWEHHKLEYSHHDQIDLMRRFFRDVRQPADAGYPHADVWRDEVNARGQVYPNIANPLVCAGPIR